MAKKDKMVCVRVKKATSTTFGQVCDLLKIDKSAFLRACIKKVVEDRENFLPKVGYVKKEIWVRKKNGKK